MVPTATTASPLADKCSTLPSGLAAAGPVAPAAAQSPAPLLASSGSGPLSGGAGALGGAGASGGRTRGPGAAAGSPPMGTPRSMVAPSIFSDRTDIDQLRAVQNVALFSSARDGEAESDSDSEDGADGGGGAAGRARRRPWWRGRRMIEAGWALGLAAVLAAVGAVLHYKIPVSHRATPPRCRPTIWRSPVHSPPLMR
jgi:hypothetical protein